METEMSQGTPRYLSHRARLGCFFIAFLVLMAFLPNSAFAFSAGDRVNATDYLNVRNCSFTTCTLTTTMSPGSTGTISSGPYSGSGFTWWYINWDNGYSGYSVQDYLAIVTAPPPTISSITPNPVTGSASPQTITIYGTGFVNKPTLTLTWTGQSGYTVPTAQVTYVSSTQLQMAITTTTTADNWTVKVTNPNGQVSNIAGFAVVAPPTTTPTLSFTATPGSITSGQSSTLSWSSTNATSCTASGGWTGAKSVSGSQVVSPSATTTYTLSCSGAGGSVTQSATVTVAEVTTGSLTVTVKRSDTNALLSGATVSLSGGPSSSPDQPTGGDGTATFSNLAVGSYTVTASLGGFQTNRASATVSADTTTPITIPLTPTGPTTGTLNVTTTPVNGGIFVDGMLRGNGSISIQLAAGSYTVSFGEVSGYTTPSQRPVTITANEIRVIAVTYDVIVLEKVNLLSPSNDATGVSITPSFSWNWVNGANRYWLMVATDPSHFPTDPNATSCPTCVISGFTDSTSHTLPHDFPFGGRSGTLSINTLYYWKVQARNANGARGDYSDAFRLTTKAPELTQPQRPEPPADPPVPPTQRGRAVVITHGWNATASDWVLEMAGAFCRKLGWNGSLGPVTENGPAIVCQINGWDVWVVDWRLDAEAWRGWEFVGGGLRIPLYAKINAELIGERFAFALNKWDYEHIHFVAHSAGANLIDTATRRLKVFRPTTLTIHETFLDAYDNMRELSSYGKKADWADNYVDTRPVFDLGKTALFLENAYSIDVTGPTIPELTPPQDCRIPGDGGVKHLTCRHSRPYRFYGLSITGMGLGSFVGDAEHRQADPIYSTAAMGYSLSVEGGATQDTSFKVRHTPNSTCKVIGEECHDVTSSIPSGYLYQSTPPSLIEVGSETTAAVDCVLGTDFKLFTSCTLGKPLVTNFAPQQIHAMSATATPGATTEEHLVVNVTTTSPVNTLRFNWSFAAAGEGLLRVFVGGNLVRQIDQRHVTPSSPETEEIYIGGVGEPLPPGTHRITFRLDGFGASASGVELTDVELGLVAGPLTFPADTLPMGDQGVTYVYDLLAEGGMPPYTWSVIKGKLPKGLTLDAEGTLSGIPTKAKTAILTVQVADAAGASATQDLSLQIAKSVKLKTKKLRGGTVGTPYSATLKTKGGISPLAFSLVGGALPSGLILDPGTGQVSGTPAAAGTFEFVAQVTSSGGSSHQKNIRIKIK